MSYHVCQCPTVYAVGVAFSPLVSGFNVALCPVLSALAHVLTVHKAQGSQWDDVVLFDESDVFRENRGRWLYTGVTRAAKRLTVVV